MNNTDLFFERGGGTKTKQKIPPKIEGKRYFIVVYFLRLNKFDSKP